MIRLGLYIRIRMIIFMLATAQIYVSGNTDDVFLCLFRWGGGQNFRYKKTRKGLHYILQQASVLISHTMHLFVNRVAIENYCLIAIKRDCYPVNISENVLDTAASRWESVSSDSSPSNWTVRLKVLYFIRNFIISKSSREAW